MAQTIKGGTILLKLDDGNTIELYTAKTKKAKKSTDDLNRSEQTLNRNFKGASQQSSNTTKNFSKMAQGITGGLVPAYATLAANIFAIGAAFRFLQDAANYRILIEGQREYATITGESLKLLTSRLQEATGQQLAFAEAAQSVAIARAAGVTTDQIGRLGVLAKNASIALGRDLTDSLNRLIRGVTKAEPELLDELGIILRLEIAAEKYGRTIGKTKNELSIFEKSQAVVNEVLSQGEEKFGNFNTELNAFTKLAKSFDDLLNRIKSSLTGVAEFIATALTKNTTALAGSFALLGSGILSAISPQVPAIDMGKAVGQAQKDIGKFYTGKNLEKFQSGNFNRGHIKQLERSMAGNKSTVLNFEKFRRAEAKKTVAILKMYNLQMEADAGGSYAKMKASFLGTLYVMQAEYGKFVGTMKFLGLGLTKAISFIGYAGLLISLIGILDQLLDRFRDPAILQFEENSKRTVRSLKEQNKEIGFLNKNLTKTKTLLAAVGQMANFFSNFSFAGASMGFGDKPMGDEIKRRYNVGGVGMNMSSTSQLMGTRLHKNQITILEETIKSLEMQRDRLKENTIERTQAVILIDLYNRAIKESSSENGISSETFKDVSGSLREIGEEGTLATKRLQEFSTVGRILQDSASEIDKALAKLRSPNTGLTVITQNMHNFGEAINEIGKELVNTPFTQLSEEFDSLFDTQTLDAMKLFLGEDTINKLLAERGPGGDPEVFKTIGAEIMKEAKRLHDFEVKMITEKTRLQTEFIDKSRGMPKIIQDEMKFRQKVLEIESQISLKKQYIKELNDLGTKDSDAQIQKELGILKNLEAQLTTAERLADITTRAKDQLVDTFATSMQTAIQGLIEGTMSLKDAFSSMTKAVLQMMAQILAKMLALKLLGMMGLPIPMAEGGIIPMAKGGITGYRSGGIATEPTYLVGEGKHNEAVVPLPDGRSIPVNMKGGGDNNIVINVDAGGNASSTGGNAEQGKALGMAIQMAVMETIQREKRPGGVLS